MRVFTLILAGFLTLFMIACQPNREPEPEPEPEPLYGGLTEKEIEALGITMEEAVKELTHEPTGVVVVETDSQSVEIDFGIDEWMEYSILSSYYDDKDAWLVDEKWKTFFDSIPSLGKLIAVYKANILRFMGPSSSWPHDLTRWNGSYVCTKLEYALAQECIKDDCNPQTRKAVMQIAIEKQKRKHFFAFERFYMAQSAIHTGAFLISTILVKENYDAFIKAVHENEELKVITLSLKWPPEDDRGLFCCINQNNCDLVLKFAEDFLSNQ